MKEEIKSKAKEFRYIKTMEVLRKANPSRSEVAFIKAWADMHDNYYLKKLIKEKEEEWNKKEKL